MTDEPIQAQEIVAEPPGKKRSPALIFIGSIVVVLLVIGAVGAFALRQADRFGDRMASAEAMPPDTLLYMDFDFGSLGDLDRMMTAFDAMFAEVGVEPNIDGLLAELDVELRAEFGVGVDDVKPWVGRDVGFGISDIDLNIAALESDPASVVPDVLAAISVRDRNGADEFIDKMVGILESRDFVVFNESTYQEVRILVSETDISGQQLAVARSGDLILLANSESAVRRGIDAQAGESMADDATMAEAIDALPSGQAMTMYMSGRLIDDLLGGLTDLGGLLGDGVLGQTALPELPENTVESLAMGMALTGDGVQFDLIQVSKEDAQPGVASLASAGGSSEMALRMPEDTFIYLGIDGGEVADGEAFDLNEILAQSGFDPDELAQFGFSIDEIEAELGFDIQDDFLNLLTGGFGAGVFTADNPIFGDSNAPFVGASALVGVSDPARMASTVDKIADFAGRQGLPLAQQSEGGGTLYGFSDGDTEIFVFGVTDEFLVVASDAGAAREPTGRTLGDNELFRRAAAALPQSGDPAFFVDLRAALRAFDAPPEAVQFLDPIEGMVANASVVGRISHFTLLTLIDY